MTVSNKLTRRLFRRRSDAGSPADRPDTSYQAPSPTWSEANRRRTEITVETERITRITRGEVSAAHWCGECKLTVWMLKPEEAAVLCGLATREIYRLVEARRLHVIERPEELLVCLRSLQGALSEDVKVTRILESGGKL